ncbi:MAG: RING-HC finger protein [bacterium]
MSKKFFIVSFYTLMLILCSTCKSTPTNPLSNHLKSLTSALGGVQEKLTQLENTLADVARTLAENSVEPETCILCYEHPATYMTPCNHHFCPWCITKFGLLNQFEEKDFTCPSCRRNLDLEHIQAWYKNEYWKNKTWDEFIKEIKATIRTEAIQRKNSLEQEIGNITREIQRADAEQAINLHRELHEKTKELERTENVLKNTIAYSRGYCPICMDDNTFLYTTSCNHQICYSCINEIAMQAKENNETSFPCPLCRKPIELKNIDHQLFTSTTIITEITKNLLNQIEELKREKAHSTDWSRISDISATIESKIGLLNALDDLKNDPNFFNPRQRPPLRPRSPEQHSQQPSFLDIIERLFRSRTN